MTTTASTTEPAGAQRGVTVYGASDDLIEIEGDLTAEFNRYDVHIGCLLALSDGTVLKVLFDSEGIWRIEPITRGMAAFELTRAEELERGAYSDRAELTGVRIDWVVVGDSMSVNTDAAGGAR